MNPAAFQKLDRALALQDIQAAIEAASVHGKVGVVGYCFGGLLTWLAAMSVPAILAQYGAATAGQYLGQKGKKPLVHYDYLVLF